ncbi:MAG TPA: hypothetical protein VFV31_11165 [Chitinophagaceae bacterium]|nr:hypothetical protein [Chitinophagaceae bacterium]
MFNEIIIKYFHPVYKLGMQDIRNVWLMAETPVRLTTCIHRGNLVFRYPGTGKRISYRLLKQGLIKKTIVLKQRIELLPF